MITLQQYLEAKKRYVEAKKIIHDYEAHEAKEKKERLLKLKKNDYIEYIGGTKSKHLTKGKKYRLTCESWSGRLAIINDAGQRVIVYPRFFKF